MTTQELVEWLWLALGFGAALILLLLVLVVYLWRQVGWLAEEVDALGRALYRRSRDLEAYREVSDLRDRRLSVLERRVHDHEVSLSVVTGDVKVE